MSRHLDRYPSTPGPRSESIWLSRQVASMAAAWDRGEHVTAAELLARLPDIDTESAIRLIYEEICLRREAGQEVDLEEVLRRFPRWDTELRDLLDCDRLLGSPGETTVLPKVGETLGPFRLLAELGRGATGCTFLASEPTLADRPVVVKVMSSDQDEHLALARLQHTHIIPLFSEHLFPARGLRVLCMPYLGGASLAQVMTALARVPAAKRSGRLVVELIDRTIGPVPSAAFDGPFRRNLERINYVQAVTWIAACLADGLHYAHARGLVHMDLKPSNVLITGDCQPMLLDFHLARGPVRPGDLVTDRLGGTRGWMSPEQEAAIEAVELGKPITTAVDGRTDIYALGLLIREMFAAPSSGRDGGSWRSQPGVSVGLADIVRKCLQTDPAHRYADVATLADDLRRHLNDLPLRGVSNRSPAESLGKLRRRRPGVIAWGFATSAILAVGAVALGISWTVYRGGVEEVRSAVYDARRLIDLGQYEQATALIRRGQASAANLPYVQNYDRALELDLQLKRAQRGIRANKLHIPADAIRFQYSTAPASADEARRRLGECQAIWDKHKELRPTVGTELDAATERQIRTDLLEVVIVGADLCRRLAGPGQEEEARLEAVSMLDAAEAELGPSFALALARRGLERKLPASGVALIEPRSPSEHLDLGRYYLRADQIAAADAEFHRCLTAQPQDIWANFFQGMSAYLLGHYEDAVAAFRTSIALAPGSEFPYYNRAVALEALERNDEAILDYSRALEIDPKLADARLNRGILAYKAGRLTQAIDDYQEALKLSQDDETLGRIHLDLAIAYSAMGDRVAALEQASKAVARHCKEAERYARDLKRGVVAATPPLRAISSPVR